MSRSLDSASTANMKLLILVQKNSHCRSFVDLGQIGRSVVIVVVGHVSGRVQHSADQLSGIECFQASLQAALFSRSLTCNQKDSICQIGPNARIRQWKYGG